MRSDLNPISVVLGPFESDLKVVEGTDQEFIIWRAPKACEIVEVWTVVNAAIGAGTLEMTLLDKGTAGTATGTTVAQHGTATAFSADTPVEETITEGTLDEDDYVSVKLSNKASGTTVTVNSLLIGLEYVCGYPAGKS